MFGLLLQFRRQLELEWKGRFIVSSLYVYVFGTRTGYPCQTVFGVFEWM